MLNKVLNTAYSIGAAIVVFGAWGKIEHKDFGDTALTAGLLTEVVLFLVYGIMEWRKEPETTTEKTIANSGNGGNTEELTDALKGVSTTLNKIFRV